MTDFFADNRMNWDDRAEIHFRDESGSYGVQAFLAGGDSLHPIEASEVGDVRGLRVAHLQCHFGLDTLSLARRGASCVGLDFSPKAIGFARQLQARTGLDARFVEGDVLEARSLIEGTFDLVYVTWGAIAWLPDVRPWAQVVSSLLKPGGALYLLEGHPFLMMLDERKPDLAPGYDYSSPPDRPITVTDTVSYTGDSAKIAHGVNHGWNHSLSDILMGIVEAGMTLEWFREHEKLAWQFAPVMEKVPGSRDMWALPRGFPRLPLAFSLRAVKG